MAPALLKPVAGLATGLAAVLVAVIVSISTGMVKTRLRITVQRVAMVRLSHLQRIAVSWSHRLVQAFSVIFSYLDYHWEVRYLVSAVFVGCTATVDATAQPSSVCMSVPLFTGQVRVPLPAPAHNKFVNLVPQGVLPWKPHPLKVCLLSQVL